MREARLGTTSKRHAGPASGSDDERRPEDLVLVRLWRGEWSYVVSQWLPQRYCFRHLQAAFQESGADRPQRRHEKTSINKNSRRTTSRCDGSSQLRCLYLYCSRNKGDYSSTHCVLLRKVGLLFAHPTRSSLSTASLLSHRLHRALQRAD